MKSRTNCSILPPTDRSGEFFCGNAAASMDDHSLLFMEVTWDFCVQQAC